jgi:hypothetical protein
MSEHLPMIQWSTAEAVAKIVGVDHEGWMQDWPLEVANCDRVEEFISHYEAERNPEHRLAIASLIVASLEEAFCLTTPSQKLLDRAAPIVRAYPEIVEYWACPEVHTEDKMFHITLWIRKLT